MTKIMEKRKHPRILLRALVDYESQNTFLYDYSENLSEGGIFIQTEKPKKIGDEFDLKFSLPDIDKIFKVKGVVKWINADDSEGIIRGMGVAFSKMNEEDKKLIQKYIKEFQDK